ncbi:TIGR03086 family metal-binding protein [Amycolatopsis rhabdoformis]|uniref:TIGR03086 family metal-binding protein n=1 Tax=Amycolatopsis rhabdoformis TaxID=1448059 RepID=A0ABZ1I8I7_9PSEU|nr:TIGR03086 family metal-binding protein [Amycolatopsis rhabdoformis]WSE30749.1 TIGR03086 family metal-binding protein [Amycolatopsis rhabdoformis]
MTTTFELDRQSLLVLDKILAGTTDQDLSRPTPCEGWNLAELLRHQVSENHAFAEAVRRGEAADWDAGRLGEHAYAAYAASVDDFLAAFGEEGALQRQLKIHENGPFVAEIAAAMHLVDTVVHGWDLAKTFGVPYEPVPEAVHAALAFAGMVPTDPGERAVSGAFGALVEVPEGADELDRLIGLLGRDPGWKLS